ncbi:MAG: ATP-binding cassette domain-containing protein [Byssovorax sp.]
MRENVLELYLLPFERGAVVTLPASEVVTARLATALAALVGWAVDGVAMTLAALLALPLLVLLLARTLGLGVLLPLALAGLAGGLVTLVSARRVERAWTGAWKRSRALYVGVSAGFEGAIELRAHGQSRAYADRLRADLKRWSHDEGRARIESTIATWGALCVTLAVGLGAGWLFQTELPPGQDLARTLLLVLAAVPTLQTLVAGAGAMAGARDELHDIAARLDRVMRLPPEESDAPLDARAEIALSGVDYRYPANDVDDGSQAPVLRGLDLVLPPAESLAVVGPNGAGKTTLLHLLLGVLSPDRGAIAIDGQPARLDNRRFRARVAFVSQRPFTLPEASVAENLRAFDPGLSDARLIAALERAHVWETLRSRAEGDGAALALPLAQLSTGEARRVMLARALLREADLLVLDEPEAHLDRAGRADLLALLQDLARERRVIAVVHDRALASFADRVIELGARPDEEDAS